MGRVSAGLDLDFLNGLDHGLHRRRGDQVVHDADAVQRHFVLDLARTGAVEILARGCTGSGSFGALQHAGSGGGEAHGVAAIQRQFGDVAGAKNLRYGGVVGLDRRNGSFHRDRLGHRAHRQQDVGSNRLIDVPTMPGLDGDLFKTGLFHGDAVHADTDEFDGVMP